MTDEEAIESAEARLRAAMLASDAVALDELLAERLVFTDQNGRILGKADDLALHRSGLLELAEIEMEDRQIRPLGDAAVVTARVRLAGSYGGTGFAGLFAYTRVWRRSPRGWEVEVAHCSAVA
jgi:ketosteroid isomerase-like protein